MLFLISGFYRFFCLSDENNIKSQKQKWHGEVFWEGHTQNVWHDFSKSNHYYYHFFFLWAISYILSSVLFCFQVDMNFVRSLSFHINRFFDSTNWSLIDWRQFLSIVSFEIHFLFESLQLQTPFRINIPSLCVREEKNYYNQANNCSNMKKFNI